MPNFEVFTKRSERTGEEPTITMQKGGLFSLNGAAHEALDKPEAVELLFDREERIIGFRAVSPDLPHAYAVRKQPGTKSVLVSGKAFVQHWSIGVDRATRFPAKMMGNVLAVERSGPSALARPTRVEKMMGTE